MPAEAVKLGPQFGAAQLARTVVCGTVKPSPIERAAVERAGYLDRPVAVGQ